MTYYVYIHAYVTHLMSHELSADTMTCYDFPRAVPIKPDRWTGSIRLKSLESIPCKKRKRNCGNYTNKYIQLHGMRNYSTHPLSTTFNYIHGMCYPSKPLALRFLLICDIGGPRLPFDLRHGLQLLRAQIAARCSKRPTQGMVSSG